MLDINVIHRQGQFRVDAGFQGAPTGVTALFGPSGAGKTSIVNMVAGLVRPDNGRIAINGTCLFDAAHNVDLPPEKRRIGYVFQDGRLFPHLTVRSNLTYGMRRIAPAGRFVHLDEVVALLGIDGLLDRRPASLSGGEKQRVAIGRALLTSPAMLLMDEPLASLDASRKAEVLPFIHRLSQRFDVPILYVSHDPREIFSLAAHLVVVDDGRVVATGTVAELTSRKQLHSYLTPLDERALFAGVSEKG
jgi:molybdate transport system ATP-binding protein